MNAILSEPDMVSTIYFGLALSLYRYLSAVLPEQFTKHRKSLLVQKVFVILAQVCLKGRL